MPDRLIPTVEDAMRRYWHSSMGVFALASCCCAECRNPDRRAMVSRYAEAASVQLDAALSVGRRWLAPSWTVTPDDVATA